MSPEQARGRVHELDRRADVYGLGATLYAILAGRPPFVEHDPTERLRQLLQDPPDSLRRSDASIPVDVEAIAMKCLRKHPHERYPSARALADDLHRFLDGQPIEARPTTFLYRSRLWAERNKPVVAIAVAAMILSVVFVAREAYNGWDAARRVRLAQLFGQRVEQIEALARYSHMAPLHDIRNEREMICERVDDIARRMDLAGPIAIGPGHYAMGRGYLAMGSHERARQELEIAWESGFREPSVAYALGQVMGELYETKLQEVERIPDAALREARRREVEERYRQPAVRYLRQSRGSELESPGLIEARLAYLEERYEEALRVSRETTSSFPWLYEAKQLEGDVYRALATEKGHRGLHDAAMADYGQAETAYRSAAAVAGSDPFVHTALCKLAKSVMRTQFVGRGDDITPQFEKGLQACHHALTADPVCVEALVAQARLHEAIGESLRQRGLDPTDHLALAVARARDALEIRPEASAAFSTICVAESERAEFMRARGNDPAAPMQAAFVACRRAVELSPDAESFNELGLVFKARAIDERDRGDDPREILREAIEAFRSSLARNATQVAANNNLGLALFHLGKYEMNRGQDPRDSFSGAVGAYRQALAINPDQIVVCTTSEESGTGGRRSSSRTARSRGPVSTGLRKPTVAPSRSTPIRRTRRTSTRAWAWPWTGWLPTISRSERTHEGVSTRPWMPTSRRSRRTRTTSSLTSTAVTSTTSGPSSSSIRGTIRGHSWIKPLMHAAGQSRSNPMTCSRIRVSAMRSGFAACSSWSTAWMRGRASNAGSRLSATRSVPIPTTPTRTRDSAAC